MLKQSFSVVWRCWLVAAAGLFLTATSLAQEQHAGLASYFPETTLIYLESQNPDRLIGRIETHPAVQSIQEMPQVRQAMRSPEFAMLMLGIGLLESQLDEPLLEAIKTCTAGGLAIGVDGQTEGVAVLFQSRDEAKLKRLAGSLLNMAATTARQQGKKDLPYTRKEYRDAVVAEFDGFLVARYQSWFVVANKPKLAKSIVDTLIDGPAESLSHQDWFHRVARQNRDADLWAAVDLETIRASSPEHDLFRGRTNNPGAELVLGGLFDAFQHAPVATGQLNLGQHLDLSVAMPFDKEWATEARRYFFGPDFDGVAPQPLLPRKMIANLTSYRDVADWWLSKEDLFTEDVIAQLAQADSQLATIFSGMDFGEDVLGALQPGLQIIVAENSYDEKYVPDLKLPAFAMVGRLKDPQQIQRKLKIAFQSVIGFANLNLGMQGQPQLDLETQTHRDAKISTAQYYYDDDTEQGLILFNFSPTIAFQGEYFIASSSRDLAIELAEVAAETKADDAEGKPTNTAFRVDGPALAGILRQNREPLIANNMLEEGNSRREAESAIEVLLQIVDLIEGIEGDFQVRPEEMRFDFQIRMQSPPTSSTGN